MEKTPTLEQSGQSPQESYEKNLQEAMKIASAFNDLKLKGNNADSNIEDLQQKITDLLSQRVELLRQSNLPTIDDFPESRITEDELDYYNYRSTHRTYDERLPEVKRIVDKVESFFIRAKELAQDLGYDANYTMIEGPWLSLEKAQMRIPLEYSVKPSESGIGGNSRISVLQVTSEGKDIVCLFQNRKWKVACQDSDVQKEIDKIVATFS